MSYTETKFRTMDGVQLCGRVYATEHPGPGLVMCPGFNCVLTMLNLPALASALQERGVTTLLYDPRTIGSSGGEPRNDIDPPQSVSDISDALTHLMTLPSVEPEQAGILGYSFGGTVALTAATLDPRCCFVVAVAPLTDLDFASGPQRKRVLRKCMQDRESQVMGNPAFTVALLNDRGENAVGFGRMGPEVRERYSKLVKRGLVIEPGHVNRVTLMTYYKVAMWSPWPLWKYLGSEDGKAGLKGAIFVVPGEDSMSYPEMQRKYYEEILEGLEFKKWKIEVDRAGHEDVFSQQYLEPVVDSIAAHIQELF